MNKVIKTILSGHITIRKFENGMYDFIINDPNIKCGNAITLKIVLQKLLSDFERSLKYPITNVDEVLLVSVSDETGISSPKSTEGEQNCQKF